MGCWAIDQMAESVGTRGTRCRPECAQCAGDIAVGRSRGFPKSDDANFDANFDAGVQALNSAAIATTGDEMSRTYSEIAAEIEKLQAEAKAIREREIPEVIERIRLAIAEYGLTASDLGFSRAGKAAAKRKRATTPSAGNARAATRAQKSTKAATKTKRSIPPKYRDGADTWTGRGLKPRWLQAALAKGGRLEDYLISK